MGKALFLAAAMMLAAAPATADVKAGVDAWSRGDYRAAVEQWGGPAAAGDADAQFNMGQAYKLGRGVPTDMAAAIEWYRKAAVQGHAQAIDNYGLALFQEGRKGDALQWLEKSAARDEKRTQLVLGTMLFNGDGVAKDWVRAYALVTRSSQQSLPQASQTLAQMDQYIPEADRQRGIAMAREIETRARTAAIAAPAPGGTTGRTVGASYPPPPPADTAAKTPKPAVAARTEPKAAVGKRAEAPAVTKADPGPAVATRAEPKPVPVVRAEPKPAPAAKAAPVPGPAAGGGKWRIQLGAFRDTGNATALWAKVGGRTGGSPDYVKGGGVTRLQATGFASRAAAQAACGKSGVSCVVVAP